jgi:hypothetical protein
MRSSPWRKVAAAEAMNLWGTLAIVVVMLGTLYLITAVMMRADERRKKQEDKKAGKDALKYGAYK